MGAFLVFIYREIFVMSVLVLVLNAAQRINALNVIQGTILKMPLAFNASLDALNVKIQISAQNVQKGIDLLVIHVYLALKTVSNVIIQSAKSAKKDLLYQMEDVFS